MKRTVPWLERKRRGKGRNPNPKQNLVKGGKKKYMSKIKFFHCHEFRHYAMKCPHKKTSKNTSGGVAGEALASQFEHEITFIACMATTMMGSVWYLDSGTSFHMMRNRDFLSDLEEKDLQIDIEMGDYARYIMNEIGTITF